LSYTRTLVHLSWSASAPGWQPIPSGPHPHAQKHLFPEIGCPRG